MPGANATICKWLTPEEILEATTNELKIVQKNAQFHMSDMQRKYVELRLQGDLTDTECALQAGYKKKNNTPGSMVKRSKKVVHALRLGYEILARESEATAEWVRSELRELLTKAKDEGDNVTITKVLQEFSKLQGLYAAEQMKLLHAGHDGNALDRQISNEEWETLSQLQHEVRKDDDVIDVEVIDQEDQEDHVQH